jgi:hypothetical protein
MIFRMIDMVLARRIADGDVCPISREDMEDINPKFNPGRSKLPLQSHNSKGTHATPKEKKRGGLLSFFSTTFNSHSWPKY